MKSLSSAKKRTPVATGVQIVDKVDFYGRSGS